MSSVRRPRVTVLYHFMYPDEVVSARHFEVLARGLHARGWDVDAWPANRSFEHRPGSLSARDRHDGVTYRRVWRPNLDQASARGRLANSAWMLAAWSVRGVGLGSHPPDVVLLGSDPVLSVATARTLKLAHPHLPVAHWAYDLYPEAAIADGLISDDSAVARISRALASTGYRACDLIADIGPCMRARIDAYGHQAKRITLPPWALSEPAEPLVADPEIRRQLFGSARLGVLYSGSFGRAHAFESLLQVARRVRQDGIHFCFAVRGNRVRELKAAVRPEDTNVSFAGFCTEAELAARLAAADVHAASLHPTWSGIVVPSKFFGSLAAGRPVVFEGSHDSGIAYWIDRHHVGLVVTPERLDGAASALREWAADASVLRTVQRRCHAVYHQEFARERALDHWDAELRALVDQPR
jgi:colanic acid biosynthesis glycosyl transferase WcaI